MVDYIFSIILLIITLIAIELRKCYHEVPKNELRHLAREGDKLAEQIYKAVAYGESLEAFLWLVIIICLSASLIIFNQVAPFWLDFIAIILFLWMAFAWLPRLRVNSLSEKLVIYLTPGVAIILNYFHPLYQKINKFGRSKTHSSHTGIYDRQGLIDLIKKQKDQADSRINPDDLDLIIKGLKFKTKKVNLYAHTWSKIDHLKLGDSIGPVLLDEVHKKNQLFIPVLAEKGSHEVVGIVDVSRINLSQAKDLEDVMEPNTHYLNEEDTLGDALSAMVSTGSQVFIVVDKKKRPFGLITLKDVLSEFFKIDQESKDYSLPTEEEAVETDEATVQQEDSPDGLKSSQSVE